MSARNEKTLLSLAEAGELRWLHTSNAGTDRAFYQRLRALDQGVRISNSSASAEPIAQTAIGGLLSLARGFPAWAEGQRAHEWRSHEGQTPELRGQTIVVVGLGAIGGHIARLAQALGLHVIGVRRSPRRDDDNVDELVTPGELASVLPRADWLALAVPLTDDTRGLIDASAFAALPPGARVLNVARGEVIDEPAMIAALRSGALAGAYLRCLRRGAAAALVAAMGPAQRDRDAPQLRVLDRKRGAGARHLSAQPRTLGAG